jgi:hypothetical protein
MQANGIFSEVTACSGTNPIVFTTRECTVEMETLRNEPFNLQIGSLVLVRVVATNSKGTSDISDLNAGGAII